MYIHGKLISVTCTIEKGYLRLLKHSKQLLHGRVLIQYPSVADQYQLVFGSGQGHVESAQVVENTSRLAQPKNDANLDSTCKPRQYLHTWQYLLTWAVHEHVP